MYILEPGSVRNCQGDGSDVLSSLHTHDNVQWCLPPASSIVRHRLLASALGQLQIVFAGGCVWLVLWIVPALKTRAQRNSNNHLTDGNHGCCLGPCI